MASAPTLSQSAARAFSNRASGPLISFVTWLIGVVSKVVDYVVAPSSAGSVIAAQRKPMSSRATATTALFAPRRAATRW